MTDDNLGRTPLFSRSERVVAWLVGLLLAVGLSALVLWHLVFVRIPAGHVGVYYSLLFGGTRVDEILPEGLAAKLPWDRIYIYETRVQRAPYQLDALSAQGMRVNFTGNVLYRPDVVEVGRLQKEVGPYYRERLVVPVILAAMRETIASYDSHDLYSIDYDLVRDRILELVRQHQAADMIYFEDLLVTEVGLPTDVVDAIEAKLSQEQLAESYEFRLQAERYEAERKRIEAIGIQTFYAIVSESLNDTVLTWRGIEATVDLSRSQNTKVVVVGGGRDQLPLILGSDITQQPSMPVPLAPVAPEAQPALPDFGRLPSLFPETRNDQALPPQSDAADSGDDRFVTANAVESKGNPADSRHDTADDPRRIEHADAARVPLGESQ